MCKGLEELGQDAERGDGAARNVRVARPAAAGGRGDRSRTERRNPQPSATGKGRGVLVAIAGLCGVAGLFVGADVVEHHLFPELSIAWRHALLTTRAAIVTVIACTVVYVTMRRQQVRLTNTAEQLSQALGAYRTGPQHATRFENPHRVRCRDVLECDRMECPMFALNGRPCWQVVALSDDAHCRGAPDVTIEQCRACKVYKLSCPDGLTELGESLNSLMFLLDEEVEHTRSMRAQMVEKEKMVAIGQMAAGIAHEIGNPLSSISSIVQMLKRKPGIGRQEDQLALIQTHIQRISQTVRQLAGLARPVPERWELVDLGPTLEEAIALVSFDRRAKGVRIEFEKPGRLPRTYAVRGQLQQVFINLLLNAFDAMPEGGALTVRSKDAGRAIVFAFTDTGRGISAAIGRRVFEPFFTTKEQGHGTGLGLSVSYGIVQKHGGRIDFESGNGSGTTFTLELPILARIPKE